MKLCSSIELLLRELPGAQDAVFVGCVTGWIDTRSAAAHPIISQDVYKYVQTLASTSWSAERLSVLTVIPRHWSLLDPEWADKHLHDTPLHLHCPATQPPRLMVTCITAFPKPKAGISTPAGEAELPNSTRFKIQQCRKKEKRKSSLIYSPAMVKMKNWAIVFRHNRQLLKEIKKILQPISETTQQLGKYVTSSIRNFYLPTGNNVTLAGKEQDWCLYFLEITLP